jgi:hypothetical protein
MDETGLLHYEIIRDFRSKLKQRPIFFVILTAN